MNIKNFKLLDDFVVFEKEDQKKIFTKIQNMNKMIKDNNTEYFGFELRTTLEEIFDSCKEIYSDGSLNSKIINVKTNYYIPTNVLNGLFAIKNLSNRESHAGNQRKSDKPYNIIITTHEAESSLRNLWLFLKWIIIEIKKVKDQNLEETKYIVSESFSMEFKNDDVENTNDDMEANKLTMAQLILSGNYKFNIPTYQREYTWGKNNIKKLLRDIELRVKDNRTHYFGSLAVAIDQKNNILRIIDGQQRITTSLLILKAFFDVFSKRKLNIPTELKKFGEEKIKGIYINQDVLSSQAAVTRILKSYYERTDKMMPILPFNNMKQIQEWLEGFSNDEIHEVYATFSTKFEIASLLFKTTIDNEMDIFENLNTGGTKLTDWDLIRSYIFSKIKPDLFLNNEKIIDKEVIKKMIIPLNAYTNNNYQKPILDFFTIYTRYKHILLKKEVLKERQTHESFKELWPNEKFKFKKFDKLSDFSSQLSEIGEIMNIFIELRYAHKENSSALHGYSHVISLINRDDVMPLLIHSVINHCVIDENGSIKKISDKFINIIRTIEAYFVRTGVYGNNLANDFDKFIKIHNEIKWEDLFDYLKTSSIPMGSLLEFEQKMSVSGQIKPNNLINILTHLEHKLREIKPGESGHIRMEKTHEHIIARKLPFKDYDDKTKDEQEFMKLQNEKQDSVGNALLLSLGNNAKAGNKAFSLKKPIYKKSSELAKGNKYIMNLITKDNFTFDDVDERAKQIANYIIKSKIYLDKK